MSVVNLKKIKPLAGYVLIEPAKVETKTATGIYLPEGSDEKPQYGTVLACGSSVWESGIKEISCPVKPGDKVIYKKWGGNDFKVNDIEYQFLKFEDILAVIE